MSQTCSNLDRQNRDQPQEFGTLQNVAPHNDISLVVFDYQLSQLFGIIWLIAEYQIFRIYL
jgi:hypothetical protein